MANYRYSRDHVGEKHYADFFRDRDAVGWTEAMSRLLARADIIKPQKIPTFLRDQRRNDFIFMLPLTPETVALDYGSGWGNTSFTLSHYCRQVVAMEADAGRLRFAAAHLRHAGADNVLPIQSGNALSLPFPDETFDIVVMNGVLEWTPRSIDGRPDEVHHRVLAEVRRVLKPGGALAVAIENRYSYKWLTGIRDNHAGGLRWAAVLPRGLASLYSRVLLGHPYRTWFYSYPTLRKLFAGCGFADCALYSYHPNHVTYRNLFRIDEDANARRVLREILRLPQLSWRDRLAYRAAAAGIPYRWIAHDYMAISRKPSDQALPASPLTKLVSDHCGKRGSIRYDLRSASRSVLLEASRDGEPIAIAKYPRENRWCENIRNECNMLSHYASLGMSPEIRVPHLICAGEIFDRPVAVMAYVRGNAVLTSAHQQAVRPRIRDWLISLSRAPKVAAADAPPWLRWWAGAERVLGGGLPPPAVDTRLESFRGVMVHGDLSQSNIFDSPDGLAVIDWEFADADGLPLIDLIDFLLYCLYRSTGSYSEAWTAVFAEDGNNENRREIEASCDALAIPHDLIPALADQFLVKKIGLLATLDQPISQRKIDQLVTIYKSRHP